MEDFKWEPARGLVKLTNPRFAGLELAIARDEPVCADGGEKLHLKNDRVPSVLTFSKSARLNKHNGSNCGMEKTDVCVNQHATQDAFGLK